MKDQLKESNRPEAAPDGVDLLRAVQKGGQDPSTILAVLADSVKDEEKRSIPLSLPICGPLEAYGLDTF